jgi:hypothetical protein
MHAPLRQPPIDSQQYHKTWRGGIDGYHYFDSDFARRLIDDYNQTGNAESLNALLAHVEPLAKSILEFRCTTKFETVDEILSRIRLKWVLPL